MLQKDIVIYELNSIKEAFKKLDRTAEKVLLVTDDKNRLLGTVTDGDIRRYILKGKSLDSDIKEIYNKKAIYIKRHELNPDLVKEILIKNRIELVPILDEEDVVIDFLTWNKVFGDGNIERPKIGKIDIPVVIMAGGKGFRLEPFTRIFPKSLIPIGDKTIIEMIIDEFKRQGVKEYYVTLNAKGEMVEAYFNSIEKDYEIKYIWEKKGFLGTAGSLKFLEDKISDTFIVSNCDVIVKADLEEVIAFHKEHNASLTILSSIQHYKIPYGVIEFKKGGEVTGINEKPEYTFPINAGVYVLNRDSLEFLPEGTHFDMTDLIKRLISDNKKVLTYPVNENDYIDIGQWGEYKKAVEKLQMFK